MPFVQTFHEVCMFSQLNFEFSHSRLIINHLVAVTFLRNLTPWQRMDWPDMISILLCCAQSLEKAEVEMKNTADRNLGTYVKLGSDHSEDEMESSDAINA